MFDFFLGKLYESFSRNIIDIVDICIHMNLQEFISFTYEKFQNVVDFGGRRRNREALEDFETFCFLLLS